MSGKEHGLPAVAIVGRPNVGKSTLFNRILGGRHALVDDEPGVTRDRLIAHARWAGREFSLTDTGGFEVGGARGLAGRVRAQSLEAVAAADLVLFVVDGRAGLSPADRLVARMLAETGKPVICVVNKIDGLGQGDLAYEYYRLGLGEPQPVSAEHSRGIDELLDRVASQLGEGGTAPVHPKLRLALVGRPNVGKSSILNRLLGEERALVDSEAGTTRDSVDTLWNVDGETILLVDTAGIRRKSRIERGLEKVTVASAFRSLQRAEVGLLVVDGVEGVTDQDARIARLAWDRGRGLVLVVNKWDAVATGARDPQAFLSEARRTHPHLEHVPGVVVSALRGTCLDEILPAARRVAAAHRLRPSTRRLNEVLQGALAAVEPPRQRGKRLRLYYATALGSAPPTLGLFVNHPEHMTTAYLRYLENRLREEFPLEGTPLRLVLRARPRRPASQRPVGSLKAARRAGADRR